MITQEFVELATLIFGNQSVTVVTSVPPQEFVELATLIFGEGEHGGDGPGGDAIDDIEKISASHSSPSWQPHKAGWKKSSNKAASRPLASGEYPKDIWAEDD